MFNVTDADIRHLRSSPQTSYPCETISVKNHAFCIWNTPVTADKEIECNLWAGHTVVVLNPLRANGDILIGGENIFVLADIASDEGNIQLRATGKCVAFGRRLRSKTAPLFSGGGTALAFLGEEDKEFASSLRKRLSKGLSSHRVNKQQVLFDLMRLAFYPKRFTHQLPDPSSPPPHHISPEPEPQEEQERDESPSPLKRRRVGG